MIARTLNSSSQSSLLLITRYPHVDVCLIIIIRMMHVIKLLNLLATKIQEVSNFYTEIIHFRLEALGKVVMM